MYDFLLVTQGWPLVRVESGAKLIYFQSRGILQIVREILNIKKVREFHNLGQNIWVVAGILSIFVC